MLAAFSAHPLFSSYIDWVLLICFGVWSPSRFKNERELSFSDCVFFFFSPAKSLLGGQGDGSGKAWDNPRDYDSGACEELEGIELKWVTTRYVRSRLGMVRLASAFAGGLLSRLLGAEKDAELSCR